MAKEAAGFDKVFPIEAVMVASPWKKKRQREEEVQIETEAWKKPVAINRGLKPRH